VACILLHTHTFSPDGVSTGYVMTDLARQLIRRGHAVKVLTTTPHYNTDPSALARQPLHRFLLGLVYRSEIDGISVWHIKVPMKGTRIYSRVFDFVYYHLMSFLVGWLAVGSFDIVIAPSPPLTMGVMGWLLSLRHGVPSVYNVQEIYPDFAVHQGLITNTLLIRILQVIERFVYRRNNAVVTISQWFSDIIRSRGIPEGKLYVIPNSVDTELYRPLPRDNEFAREYQLLDSFVVMYGGNVSINLDWLTVLRAAEDLTALPIQFVVVGGGGRMDWLAAEVSGRKLMNVKLIGYQSRDLMPLINASSDLCTIPMKRNTTKDGFPSKIYTIMASGKSVLVEADEDSELRWLVQHVRCGRVVGPEEPAVYTAAIRQAFGERQLLQEEGMRGREYVLTRYSTQEVGRSFDKLIHVLTSR